MHDVLLTPIKPDSFGLKPKKTWLKRSSDVLSQNSEQAFSSLHCSSTIPLLSRVYRDCSEQNVFPQSLLLLFSSLFAARFHLKYKMFTTRFLKFTKFSTLLRLTYSLGCNYVGNHPLFINEEKVLHRLKVLNNTVVLIFLMISSKLTLNI